ncbi:MAG: hypothetical protein M3N15_00775 [Actinomycetota bacterium]|nr:hypothetical protein [Actinomycetota bacterium]
MPDQRRDDTSLPNLASELWDLVRAYAKQETVEPIKGLGRFVAFGMAGSILLGIGSVLLALAVLRALQTETGTLFDGGWSFAPYLLTLVVCAVVIIMAASAIRRKGTDT